MGDGAVSTVAGPDVGLGDGVHDGVNSGNVGGVCKVALFLDRLVVTGNVADEFGLAGFVGFSGFCV